MASARDFAREGDQAVMMRAPPALAALLRGERLVIAAGVIGLTALAWLYLALLADAMGAMSDGAASPSLWRTPMGFLLSEWRDGAKGAWAMGLRHGALCVGCCWGLMALLFVGGVMNLLWIALLAAAVLVEKLLPFGATLGRVAGLALCAGGI